MIFRDGFGLASLGDLLAFHGWGLLLGLALLVALRLLVPRAKRRCLRLPIFLFVGHLVLLVLRLVLPDPAGPAMRLPALAFLLLFFARGIYLLGLHLITGRRATITRSLPGIFRDIIQVSLYVAVGFWVLHEVGVEPGSLLTTSALLTAVIGLSLQDTLGNLFAGLAIQAQRPFEVGDWIQFDDDPDHIGEVLEINWRATRILTIDRIEVTVPNNLLAKAPIRNYSKPSRLVRRNATVLAPYESPPARVHRLLAKAVVEVRGVRAHPPPDIQTITFTERGVEYRVRYFIEEFDQREVIDSRVRDRMWYALRRAALPIPPPQRRVTLIEHNAASAEREHVARVADVEKALHRVPVLKPLSQELLHELALHTERRLYAPGEIVIQQGDYGEELFLVEKGSVEVLVDAHAGLEHVATLGVGQFFGEMSLLTGESRKATVRSDGEVALLVLGKESLQPILEAAPDLAREFSEMLAEREVALDQHVAGARITQEEDLSRRSGELLARIRDFFSL
ncbi:MAG: cyclic nucleotide-binding domain-containing protein [Sandaracinaceae bacterium]